MSPIGSLVDVKKGDFSSTEAGFRIGLPSGTGGFDGRRGIQYSWGLNEGFFYAGVEDRSTKIENSDLFESETDKVVDNLLNDVAGDLFATKFEIVNVEKKIIQFQGHKALQLRARLTDTVLFIRVFWVGERVYKLADLLTEKQQKYEPTVEQVFNSLTLTSKSETEALIEKALKENSPKPLPRCMTNKMPATDVNDEGLRGQVRSILDENQYTAGKKAGSKRQKQSETFFDEIGNRVKSVFYDDNVGFPFEIVVFGCIGRNRVSNSANISYGNEIGSIALGTVVKKPVKYDNRFQYRYVYRYDNSKRLIEKTMYDNSGGVWLRYDYKYSDHKRDEISYTGEREVNSRSSTELDTAGNEIKAVYRDSPTPGWSTVYTYEYIGFDEKGNWIKRTVTQSQTFQGKMIQVWKMDEFRTITYY